MFGINVKEIAQGWVNDALNREEELYKHRLPICKQCPLYNPKGALGAVCDSKKCYNPQTEDLVTYPKTDYICGCGCVLEKAVRVPQKKCALNKW
jgi:hypothetical protein